MYNYYIGIDIAKETNFASVLSSDTSVVIKPFDFSNDILGFEYLINIIDKFQNVIVIMESTSNYHCNLFAYLKAFDIDVAVINPILVDNNRRNSIRKVKNDKVDSSLIAKTAIMNKTKPSHFDNELLEELKSVTRFRRSYTSKRSQTKVKLDNLLNIVFPEYKKQFSDLFGKASIAVLKQYPTTSKLKRAHLSKLTSILQENSKGRFGEDKARSLIELAKSSAASKRSKSYELLITTCITDIHNQNDIIADLDKEINHLMSQIDTHITSIPGIGITLGAEIIAEIGDISKFDSPSKIVAYAGLDASVSQSGNFTASKNSISKRGSSALRYALYTATQVSVQNDPELKEYYNKLRSNGKPHKVAIVACCRKLINRIYIILKDNRPYEIRHK